MHAKCFLLTVAFAISVESALAQKYDTHEGYLHTNPQAVRQIGDRPNYHSQMGQPGRWVSELSPCRCASLLGFGKAAKEEWPKLFPAAAKLGVGGLLEAHKSLEQEFVRLESTPTTAAQSEHIGRQIDAVKKQIAANEDALRGILEKRCLATDSGPKHEYFKDIPAPLLMNGFHSHANSTTLPPMHYEPANFQGHGTASPQTLPPMRIDRKFDRYGNTINAD